MQVQPVNVVPGDVINGWKVLHPVPVGLYATPRWKAMCTTCGQQGTIRQDLMLSGLLSRCSHCA